jgi:hypothetical protein
MHRALLIWVIALIGAGLAFAAMDDAWAQHAPVTAHDPGMEAVTAAPR